MGVVFRSATDRSDLQASTALDRTPTLPPCAAPTPSAHEKVRGSLRLNVTECKALVVLVDHIGRDLLGNNLVKDSGRRADRIPGERGRYTNSQGFAEEDCDHTILACKQTVTTVIRIVPGRCCLCGFLLLGRHDSGRRERACRNPSGEDRLYTAEPKPRNHSCKRHEPRVHRTHAENAEPCGQLGLRRGRPGHPCRICHVKSPGARASQSTDKEESLP